VIDQATRDKIVSLAMEAYRIYEEARRRPSGMVCDICGAGDKNEWFKVKGVVRGYQHRPDKSPCLCPSHALGWSMSFAAFEDRRKGEVFGFPFYGPRAVDPALDEPLISDEEVNLHFARFLAKQLLKAAGNDKRQLD